MQFLFQSCWFEWLNDPKRQAHMVSTGGVEQVYFAAPPSPIYRVAIYALGHFNLICDQPALGLRTS